MNTSTPMKTPAKQPTKQSLFRDKPHSSRRIDSQHAKNASSTGGEDFSKDEVLKARLQMTRKSTSEKANKNLFEGDGKIGAWDE